MKRIVASALPLVTTALVAALAACGDASGAGGQDVLGGGSANGASGGSSASGETAGSGSGSGSSSSGGGGSSASGGTASGASDAGEYINPGMAPAPSPSGDPFAALKQGATQMASFCAKGSTDAASVALCKSPTINSLADLQSTIGLAFQNPTGTNGAGGNPAFVLLGHSTSLAMSTISAANPRAILMTDPTAWQPSTDPAMNRNGMGPPPGWNPPASGWSQPSGWSPPTITGTLATWPPWDWGCTPVVAMAGISVVNGKPVHLAYGDDDDDDDDDDGPVCFPTTIANPAAASNVAMGYTRGTGIVEIAAAEPVTNNLHFIAVKYTTANATAIADTLADAGTPTINYGASSETGWTSWTAYDDSDLADTTADCTHCHQPGGAGTPKQLRMNEVGSPWTHSMSSWTAGGQALLADFHSVHGTSESYGGIPATMIDKSEPMTLQLATTYDGAPTQPVAFDSTTIESQVAASAPGQPANNSTPGTSAAWQQLYTTGLANHTVVPYHDVKVTDPAALASAVVAYNATGNADMSNLMTVDAKTATLLTPPSTLTPTALLQASCGDCHNGNVPTTLGRGQFNAMNLAGVSSDEKSKAVARLELNTVDVHHMPPSNVHSLSSDQVQTLITLLKQ